MRTSRFFLLTAAFIVVVGCKPRSTTNSRRAADAAGESSPVDNKEGRWIDSNAPEALALTNGRSKILVVSLDYNADISSGGRAACKAFHTNGALANYRCE